MNVVNMSEIDVDEARERENSLLKQSTVAAVAEFVATIERQQAITAQWDLEPRTRVALDESLDRLLFLAQKSIPRSHTP